MMPTPTPPLRTAAALALVLTSVGGCTPPGDEASPADGDPLPVVTVPLGPLEDALYPTLLDSTLANPFDLVVADGRLWLAETNVSRLTVLTKDFELVRRIGRRGEGPGELLSPFTLRVRDGVVSAADRSTGRFELFDTAGVGIGSFQMPGGHEHALLGPDRIVAVDRDPSTFGTLIDDAGPRPFGRADATDGGSIAPIPLTQMHRAVMDGDDVVVLIPETTGDLVILGTDGTLLERRGLPAAVRTELLERQENDRTFGDAVVGSSLVKGVGVSPDGRFVSIASMAGAAPILLHDLDGRRILLVDVAENVQAEKVRNARVAVYDDGRLYVLSGEAIFAFEFAIPD